MARARTHQPFMTSDANRRRRAMGDQTDRLLHRSMLLDREDQALIVSVYRDHVPIPRLAAIRNESTRQVRRRIQRLSDRLLTPRTSYLLARKHAWEHERWAAAQRCLVAGHGMRRVADDLGISLHRVRKHVDAVRTLFDEHGRGPRHA
jgi:hypothetical protein